MCAWAFRCGNTVCLSVTCTTSALAKLRLQRLHLPARWPPAPLCVKYLGCLAGLINYFTSEVLVSDAIRGRSLFFPANKGICWALHDGFLNFLRIYFKKMKLKFRKCEMIFCGLLMFDFPWMSSPWFKDHLLQATLRGAFYCHTHMDVWHQVITSDPLL